MSFEMIDLLEDDVEVLELTEVGVPRQIYDRNEYFYSFDELAFYNRFPLTKNMTVHVLEQIDKELERPYNRNNSIAPINQLLVALRFLATGNHLLSIADFGGMHVSTVSRIVLRVATEIAKLDRKYIKFPSSPSEVSQVKREFFDIASFPSVIGAVDGTHIKIQSPGGPDAEIFRNRKSYFSINVQGVCTAKMVFIDVVARWPGSAHDATIFNGSRIRAKMEIRDSTDCVILGDSTYPQKTYLMTPLLNPRGQAEQLYNESQIRTRGPIEKAFGILKKRFPVLAYGCRLKLKTTFTIIVATCVLHNILRSNNVSLEPPESEDFDPEDLQHAINSGQISCGNSSQNSSNGGIQKRKDLINNYFSRL